MARPFISALNPSAYRALLGSATAHSRVIPIDATWYMPNVPKNGKDEFLHQGRLENAAFFDLDAVALPDSKYPHMLPPYDVFKKAVDQLKLQKTDRLVFYDKTGIFSSPRAAWTFALFGHGKSYILNHFPAYTAAQLPLDTAPVTALSTPHPEVSHGYNLISKEQFEQNYREQVIEYDELLALVKSGKLEKHYITFDARSSDRFTGAAPEPRPGLPSGHIPGSLSLPFSKVLKEDGSYKSKEELLKLFKNDYGVDLLDPTLDGKEAIVVLCGTGVTAVILRLAIQLVVGADVNIRVYDGSWTEWAQRAPAEFIQKSP